MSVPAIKEAFGGLKTPSPELATSSYVLER